MARFLKISYLLPVMLLTMLCSACSDPSAVIDKSTEIENHNWAYDNLIHYAIKIDNEKIPYNLYFNLRVTADYKYSNIFILIHQTGPGAKSAINRYEFKLANADGEWLGEGSGNLYSYQMMYLQNYTFPAKGVYHIAIEQNMRDNPLHEVSDVGLRVEKVQ